MKLEGLHYEMCSGDLTTKQYILSLVFVIKLSLSQKLQKSAWTNPPKTRSLVSLTGHFIVILKLIPGAHVVENDHTGSFIEEKLRKMIDKWNIGNKLFLLLPDTIKNMVSAMRGQFESVGCMSYTLQMVVKDALFSEKEHE